MKVALAAIAAALLAAFVMAFGGCYAHDPAPPCPNIMNCGDPTGPPPPFERRSDAGAHTDGGSQ